MSNNERFIELLNSICQELQEMGIHEEVAKMNRSLRDSITELADGSILVKDGTTTIHVTGDLKINGKSARKELKKQKHGDNSWEERRWKLEEKQEKELENIYNRYNIDEEEFSGFTLFFLILDVVGFFIRMPFKYMYEWLKWAYDIKEEDDTPKNKQV